MSKGSTPSRAPGSFTTAPRVVDGRAQSFGAVPARVEILTPATGGQVWEEARWEGKPGERTVWIISAGNTRVQELRRPLLKGTGPLRQFQPQIGPLDGGKLPAVSMPLGFVWAEQECGVLRAKWLYCRCASDGRSHTPIPIRVAVDRRALWTAVRPPADASRPS